MSSATEPTFAELVRLVAAEHRDVADPRELVPFLLEEIVGREEEALERLLPSYIGAVLRRRGPATGTEQEEWRSFLRERVPTSAGTVFAGDASADDLEAGAERRRRFAGSLDGRAARYDSAAAAMRAANVATAAELKLEDAVASQRSLAERTSLLQHARLLDAARVRQLDAMRRSRDSLAEMVAAGRSPRIELLRGYREALLERRAELIETAERVARRHEFEASLYG